jgi:hypothetical protein
MAETWRFTAPNCLPLVLLCSLAGLKTWGQKFEQRPTWLLQSLAKSRIHAKLLKSTSLKYHLFKALERNEYSIKINKNIFNKEIYQLAT